MGVFLRICDFLFVLRPLILIPAWSFYLLGAAAPLGGVYSGRLYPPIGPTLLCLTAILASAYLLNQIFDRDSDERNDKVFYLSRGLFTVRAMLIMAGFFFVIASLAFQEVPGRQQVPLLLALALSLFYSLPPIRLCARPFLDMAANAVGYGGVAFAIGHLVYDPSTAAAVHGAAPYVLLVASTFVHTTLLDIEGDGAVGKTSTAVFLGERAANSLALGLHLLAVVAAGLTGGWAAPLITGLTLPVTWIAWRRATKRWSSLQIQVTTAAVTLGAIAFWPVYGLLVAPLLALSRVYYAKRFGLTYPGPPKNA